MTGARLQLGSSGAASRRADARRLSAPRGAGTT